MAQQRPQAAVCPPTLLLCLLFSVAQERAFCTRLPCALSCTAIARSAALPTADHAWPHWVLNTAAYERSNPTFDWHVNEDSCDPVHIVIGDAGNDETIDVRCTS